MDRDLRHQRRMRRAKMLLLLIFFMLRIPDAVVYYYTYSAPYGEAERRNLVVVSLWTTVFLIAMWMGKQWARYLLIFFSGYMVFIYALIVFLVLGYRDNVHLNRGTSIALTIQALFYLGATVIVVRTRSIRSLCCRS